MRATDFEYRHQTVLHLSLVAAAFLTYLFDPDDIVWAFVRHQSQPRLFERALFAAATLLIGAGATLRTWAQAHSAQSIPGVMPISCEGPYRYLRYPALGGSLLFTIGLAFLAPFWGFVLLVAGEAILVLRLIQREKHLRSLTSIDSSNEEKPPTVQRYVLPAGSPAWRRALRLESGKWGLFLTMIVFTALLQDRVAEMLAMISLLVWLALNYGIYRA